VEVDLAHFDGNPTEAYEQFEATSLYCPHCREAVPVRKKLLLILPGGDEYEYLCTRCGSSVGIKLEKGKEEVGVLVKP
jgi:DNA-directed RNA polymerase subunit RPC12/RpoP